MAVDDLQDHLRLGQDGDGSSWDPPHDGVVAERGSVTYRQASPVPANEVTGYVSTSDEDDHQRHSSQSFPDGNAESLIGVSIGHEQTHLASLRTPAAERAAALEEVGQEFPFEDDGQASQRTSVQDARQKEYEHSNSGVMRISSDESERDLRRIPTLGSEDKPQEPDSFHDIPQDSSTRRRQTLQGLPSPWQATPRTFETTGNQTLLPQEQPKGGRRRAWSMGMSFLAEDSLFRRYLPSLPKNVFPSAANFNLPSFAAQIPFVSGQKKDSERQTVSNDKTNSSNPGFMVSPAPWGKPTSPSTHTKQHALSSVKDTLHNKPNYLPKEHEERRREGVDLDRSTNANGHVHFRAPSLRRSTSDSSLVLRRPVSRVSSLGDDTRFERVQDQVNSRFKAIKDSFADSSLKLPRMPSIASVNLAALRFPEINGVKQRSITSGVAISTLSSYTAAPNALSQAEAQVQNRVSKNDESTGFFSHAMERLTGDIVVMGGYRGSVLRSSKPPNRQLWIPVKVGLNLRKVDLEVGLEAKDEENMEDSIIPSGMLTHIGPVDISRRLLKKLRNCENTRTGKLKVWEYGYDWRLSPHLLSRKFVEFLRNLPSNQTTIPPRERGALVVAHSLGGLIARHAINLQPGLVSAIVYAGVPQYCVNILGPLRNGDEVLLSSKVLTAQVNFTIRTSFTLLPEEGQCFMNKDTKEDFLLNFFDVNTWIENCLSPCVASPLPPLNPVNSGLGSLVDAVSGGLPKFPRGKRSLLPTSKTSTKPDPSEDDTVSSDNERPRTAKEVTEADRSTDHTIAPHMDANPNPFSTSQASNSSTSTVCTIPRDTAIAYLRRTLAETLQFKRELHFRPEHAEHNVYPPIAVVYGKSVPTVYGAKVESREAIKRADAYNKLAFASGDGVCLARAAMVPPGYETVPGGRVSSERGHVTLLGDLEGVGKAIGAVLAARRMKGVGLGGATGER